MELFIDPRAGSNKLIEKFPGECQEMMLDFGDIAFWGNGPDNEPWYIGIEYKKVDDMVASIHSGRLTGTQLPGMIRLYDICFIIVEGITYMNRQTGGFMKKMGKYSTPLRMHYNGFHNALTSVETYSALAGKPCIVRQTIGIEETVELIRATYSWFQKPWESHSLISRPDQSKLQHVSYDLEVVKVESHDAEYPTYWLRKAVFQLDRVGWEVAGKIAEKYQTMEALMAETQKGLVDERIGVGGIMAERLYRSLHGHTDKSSSKISWQECDCFTMQTITATGKPMSKPRRIFNPECPKCHGNKRYKLRVDTDKFGVVSSTILETEEHKNDADGTSSETGIAVD